VPKFQDGPSFGTTFEMMPANKKTLLSDAECASTIKAIKAAP
jgi:hypothetical protein